MEKIGNIVSFVFITFFICFLLAGCQRDMVRKFEIKYPNGKLWQTGFLEYDKFGNTREYGNWTFYYENGQKLSSGQFRHGLKHGQWVYWTPDGEMMYEVTYMNGVPVDISENS
jgi:antitoxin component YwqK of YwqJK toxin-antitoxin module